MILPLADLLADRSDSPLTGSPLTMRRPGEAVPDGGVCVLVDHAGAAPQVAPEAYDALVTTRAGAPAPWVSIAPDRFADQVAAAAQTAAAAPIATAVFARLLRLGADLPFESALEVESLAYSTLLGGAEFARWRAASRAAAPAAPQPPQEAAPVRYDRDGDAVRVTLASAQTRNAMTARMRDALYEALVNVLEDPGAPRLTLQADGRCFSVGGALDEFGANRDLAQAHIIRMQRSCALILYRLGARASVRLNGACIGSGIEIAAAAAHRQATANLVVRLPELRMGLIPGAGGTVTLARAIGRHRLFWLALSAFRLGATQARDWGLVHDLDPC